MKRINIITRTIYLLVLLTGGYFTSLAQSDPPKYLREDDKAFKNIAKELTPEGHIAFPPVAGVLTDNPTKLLITNELNDQTK